MNISEAAQSYSIASPLGRGLKRIRAALADLELSIVAEFDLAPSGRRVLLVDCPLLAFEATALHRGAAVLIPLHLIVSGDDDRTQVFVTHPADLVHFWVPPGVASSLDRLQGRVALALESLSDGAFPPRRS